MPPRGKNASSSKPGAESEPQKRKRAARGGEGRKRKRGNPGASTSTSGVDSVDTLGTGYESEDAENAAELGSEDTTPLDADDSFVITSGQGGSASAGSAAAHDDSDADEDEQPDRYGVEISSAQTKQRATFPYSELAKGKRLLHVTFDVEFSHSTKVLGEIFELSARPWRVEVVKGQGEQDEWQDLIGRAEV